ncbi:MAG: hypothetical protein JJ966_08960 [Balneolaceae bacterium]|nr:hypothetical protein [Balneolaceae bacterium]
MRTKIDIYTIKIRQQREKDSYFPLDDINGDHFIDLFSEFETWLEQNPQNLNNYNKLLKYRDPEDSERLLVQEDNGNIRLFHGTFRSGDFGYSSNLDDINTGVRLHVQTPDQASTYPLFASVYINSGYHTGLIGLQIDGRFSMKTQLELAFREFLRANYEGLYIEFNTYLPSEAIDELIEDSIASEFTFIKYNADRDAFNNIGGLQPESIKAKLSLKVEGFNEGSLNPFRNNLKNAIRDRNSRYIEISTGGDVFDYDDLNIKIKRNGLEKTLTLGRLERIRGSIDITDEVERNLETNNTIFDSFRRVSQRELMEIGETIVD